MASTASATSTRSLTMQAAPAAAQISTTRRANSYSTRSVQSLARTCTTGAPAATAAATTASASRPPRASVSTCSPPNPVLIRPLHACGCAPPQAWSGRMSTGFGGLHVLTDARGGRDALAVVAAAVAAGAPVVQVRAKDCTDRVLYEFARRVVELCAAAGAVCIVNDRVDVALAVDAMGTHLGAEDLPIAAVRRIPCGSPDQVPRSRDPAPAVT